MRRRKKRRKYSCMYSVYHEPNFPFTIIPLLLLFWWKYISCNMICRAYYQSFHSIKQNYWLQLCPPPVTVIINHNYCPENQTTKWSIEYQHLFYFLGHWFVNFFHISFPLIMYMCLFILFYFFILNLFAHIYLFIYTYIVQVVALTNRFFSGHLAQRESKG